MKKKKILLIDDRKDFCDTLKPHIEAAGFKLFIASDGTEGIDLAKAKKPDLILLDIELPDTKGDVVLRKIKEDQISTRVIFVTGVRTDISDSVKFLKPGGISDYWVKGDDNSELINKIKRALLEDPPITFSQEKVDSKSEELLNTEAERNTRIYLLIIFTFLVIISSLFFYYFGLTNAFVFTLTILIISYIISAFTLKEWTLNKLPDRILEIEKDRIHKRFEAKKD